MDPEQNLSERSPAARGYANESTRRAKSGAGGGAELTAAMQKALTAMKEHGDTEYKNYRWNRGLMARAEWRNASIVAEAPRLTTLGALEKRGLVEEYHEMKYIGHGEYDDWSCWRLVAVGEETPRSDEGSSHTDEAVRLPKGDVHE